MIKATGVILAGGKSSRMNYNNKAFLKYKGKSFIEHMLDKIHECNEKIIVADNFELYQFEGVKNVADIHKDMGPLCGLYTALIESKNEKVIVMTVDTPCLSRELLQHMMERCHGYDGIVPKVENKFQPLCAVYDKSCVPIIEESLKNGNRKIQRVFKELNLYYMDETEVAMFGSAVEIFRNVNTPEEYQYLCRA